MLLEEESVCLRDNCLTLGVRDSTSMLYRVVWVLLCLGKDGFTYTLEMLIHKDSRTVVMEVEIR